jgi:hypothetical protein
MTRKLGSARLAFANGKRDVPPMNARAQTADDLVGTFRTFGSEGPAYEVTATAGPIKVHVRVLESGEELDYPVERALTDPEAE